MKRRMAMRTVIGWWRDGGDNPYGGVHNDRHPHGDDVDMTSRKELTAYCAVSPNGYPAPNTIALTPKDVEAKLQQVIRDGDTAKSRGWKVALLRCILMEFIK